MCVKAEELKKIAIMKKKNWNQSSVSSSFLVLAIVLLKVGGYPLGGKCKMRPLQKQTIVDDNKDCVCCVAFLFIVEEEIFSARNIPYGISFMSFCSKIFEEI